MFLTQIEADDLIHMEKICDTTVTYQFPFQGESLHVPLTSIDGKEQFLIDVYKGRINVKKVKYQNRAHKSVILVRVDVEGSPHENPDGSIIPCPHIHVYREGFADKWAELLDGKNFGFKNLGDPLQVWDCFLDFVNVTTRPSMVPTL